MVGICSLNFDRPCCVYLLVNFTCVCTPLWIVHTMKQIYHMLLLFVVDVFQAMVLFCGSKNFRSDLYQTFSHLCADPHFKVRKAVAAGFHEVSVQSVNQPINKAIN